MLQEPVQWKADDELIDNLVGRLARLRVVDFVDLPPTNASAAVLSDPALKVYLLEAEPPPPSSETAAGIPEPENGAAKPLEGRGRLLIGPLNASEETGLAKFENEDVFMQLRTAEILSLGLRPAEPLLYRDRTVLTLAPENIRRIHIRAGEREQAVARDSEGNWGAELPSNGQINGEALEDILLVAARMRAVWIESHNPENLSDYGLDSPGRSVTFGLTGEGGIQKTVLLGLNAGPAGVYAMVKGQDVVFVLPTRLSDVFLQALVVAPSTVEQGEQEGADGTPK